MVNAVGLGSLNVNSTLNQPLNANIDLSLDDGTLLDGVKVRLASVQAFQRAGMERPYILSKLTFKTVLLAGKPVIQVSSVERMNNPYLSLLLDITWAKGQIYRSYTILLDPPGYQIASQNIYQPKPLSKKTFVSDSIKKKPSLFLPLKSSDIKLNTRTVYGPTQKTDDLWNVALKYKPQNASMNQVMLGIIKLNPQAFIRGNINALKRDVKLNIPTSQYILETSRKEASIKVNSKMAAWKNKEQANYAIGLKGENLEEEQGHVEVQSAPVIMQNAEELKVDNAKVITENQQKEAVVVTQEVMINKEQESNVLNEVTATDEAKTSTDILKNEEIIIIPKQKVIKEKLFDDFIPIPKVLKKIVKKPLKKPLTNKPTGINSAIAVKDQSQVTPLTSEVAVAVSAIESVKESNQLLRQQVNALTAQNELLSTQLAFTTKQDESTRRKIDILMKLVEKDYLLSSEGNLIRRDSIGQAANANGLPSNMMDLLYYLMFIFAVGGGGILVFLYTKQQKNKKVTSILDEDLKVMYGNDLSSDENSSEENEPYKQYNEAVISTKEDELKGDESVSDFESNQSSTELSEDEKDILQSKVIDTESERGSNLNNNEFCSERKHTESLDSMRKQETQDSLDLSRSLELEASKEELEGEKILSAIEPKEDDLLTPLEFKLDEKQGKDELVERSVLQVKSDSIDNQLEVDDENLVKNEKEDAEILSFELKDTILDVDLDSEKATEALDFESRLKTPSDIKESHDLELMDVADKVIKEKSEPLNTLELDELEKPLKSSSEEVLQAQEPLKNHVHISTQIALAETYISMEDWQSAKESLEIVKIEGNRAQRKKAQKLLKLIPK